MRLSIAAFTLLYLASSSAFADGFVDDFSDAKNKSRAALRGEWFFENGVASCKADPELYKKFKNHGPILRWPAEFTNGTIEFQFQPSDCERVVVTLNEQGHVFRAVLSDGPGSRIFGWIGQSSKTNKPKLIANDQVPTLNDLNSRWIDAKIIFNGDTADVTIGDYHEVLTHESIGRRKGEFTISFASGELAVKNVRLSIPEE